MCGCVGACVGVGACVREREAFARFKISQIYSGNSNLSHVVGNRKAIK